MQALFLLADDFISFYFSNSPNQSFSVDVQTTVVSLYLQIHKLSSAQAKKLYIRLTGHGDSFFHMASFTLAALK